MDRAVRQLREHRWRVLIALLVVLGIAASLGLRFYLRASVESGNVGRLARLVGQHRLARAPLSGGFAHAPCTADSSAGHLVRGLACREPSASTWRTSGKLREFANDVRLGAEHSSPAAKARTSGIFNLVWDHVDDAVADLRSAVRLDPKNARALNDLAVALTVFAERHDDPSALVDAFVAADSAVRQDSMLKEARFTQALVLEHLSLPTDAIDAWNRYLQLDGKSGWATEAREHLKALQGQTPTAKRGDRLAQAVASNDWRMLRSVVEQSPSAARARMHDELDQWGLTVVGRNAAGAKNHLDVARSIAGPFRQVTGDALVSDAIAAIDQAVSEHDSVRIRTLAEGHVLLRTATNTFSGPRPANAAPDFMKAQQRFATASSPMAGWAAHWAARALITVQPGVALKLLTTLRDSTPPQYVALRSAAAQFQGLVYDIRADYAHVRSAYDTAVTENRTTREPQVTLRVASWLAQVDGLLRGERAAWRTQYAALSAAPLYQASPTTYQSFYTVFDYAGAAASEQAPRLALRYSDEALRVARQMPSPASLAYGLRRRAERLARVGRVDSARADIAAALDAANRLTDSARRASVTADVELAGAHIEIGFAPEKAEADLRRVVDEYRSIKYDKGLPLAYLYLAQSRAAAGKVDAARSAFDSSMSMMQRTRATIASYAERGEFLDAARSVIDEIVKFHAGQNPRDAFETFEATRSRVLLEQIADNRGQSVDRRPVLADLQRHLKKEDVVLSYAVLKNELLVWIITRSEFRQHHVSVTASELEELVSRFQRSLLTSDQPDSAVSERLYRRLLVDSASRLVPTGNLIVIPDRWLHFVPFAALRDPSSKQYLVRNYAVTYAPSATLLLASLGQPQEHFSRTAKVLAIGNPAFDPSTFKLPPLPEAEGEARRIAALYRDQSPLTGREATDAALERMAPAADIIHFAGHAVVGRDAPQLSHLVLASDGRSSGAVFSPAIAQWKLPRTRLVILSGCNTADGKLSPTEGAASLARAFFAAGVPTVVASLWAIEDQDTAEFFTAFHRRLADGDSPSLALGETQSKWLTEGRPVRSWAAFQLFGR